MLKSREEGFTQHANESHGSFKKTTLEDLFSVEPAAFKSHFDRVWAHHQKLTHSLLFTQVNFSRRASLGLEAKRPRVGGPFAHCHKTLSSQRAGSQVVHSCRRSLILMKVPTLTCQVGFSGLSIL